MMCKTKRNSLVAAVLTGALAFSPIAVITQSAFADGGIVAMAATSADSWTTLTDAIATTKDVALTTDVTAGDSLIIGNELTLDLGGHTLTFVDKTLTINTSSTVIIKNGTIQFRGASAGLNVDSGTLLLNDKANKLTISADTGVAITVRGGSLYVDGATISSSSNYAISREGGSVTITSGTIEGLPSRCPIWGNRDFYKVTGGIFSYSLRIDGDIYYFDYDPTGKTGYTEFHTGRGQEVMVYEYGISDNLIATVEDGPFVYNASPINPTVNIRGVDAYILQYFPNNIEAGEVTFIAGTERTSDALDRRAAGKFTIQRRPVTISANSVDVSSISTLLGFDNVLSADVESELESESGNTGLISGHTFVKDSYTFEVNPSGEAGIYTISVVPNSTTGFIIQDEYGVDVTKNYKINTEDGLLTGASALSDLLLDSDLLGNSGSLANATVTVDDVTYNGKEQKPSVTVKIGSTDVTSECTFTYSNNINVGTAKVKITPKSSSSSSSSTSTSASGSSISGSGSQFLSAMATTTITSVTGSKTVEFKIKPAAATVTAQSVSKKEGDKDPSFTASVTGMVNNESTSLIKYTITRAPGETAGTYKITPTGDTTQGNYEVTYKEGTLTITGASGTTSTSGTTSNKPGTTTGTTTGTTATTGTAATTATAAKAATANTGDSTFMGGAAIAAVGVGILGFGIFRKKAHKQ